MKHWGKALKIQHSQDTYILSKRPDFKQFPFRPPLMSNEREGRKVEIRYSFNLECYRDHIINIFITLWLLSLKKLLILGTINWWKIRARVPPPLSLGALDFDQRKHSFFREVFPFHHHHDKMTRYGKGRNFRTVLEATRLLPKASLEVICKLLIKMSISSWWSWW